MLHFFFLGGRGAPSTVPQSLELFVETRILAEMKIENREKKIFRGGKKSTSILFSMKIKMMDLQMQIEDTQLIFVMNFSVLDFFKFASRMPQTAQILVSTFKILRTPLEISSFFFH